MKTRRTKAERMGIAEAFRLAGRAATWGNELAARRYLAKATELVTKADDCPLFAAAVLAEADGRFGVRRD